MAIRPREATRQIKKIRRRLSQSADGNLAAGFEESLSGSAEHVIVCD